MSKHLDYVEQPDGSFKWELAEIPAVKSTPVDLSPGELGINESTPEKGILKGKETKKKVSKKKSDSALSE